MPRTPQGTLAAEPADMTAAVPLERIELLARLYAGENIESRRKVPFPHKFFIGHVELPEFVVQQLVDQKILDNLPRDEVWDHVTYWVKDREPLRVELLKAFPKGWGRCERCNQLLGLGRKGLAAPHGGNKALNIPACIGSGKALAGSVRAAA